MLLDEFLSPIFFEFLYLIPVLCRFFFLFIAFCGFAVTDALDVMRKVDYEDNAFAVFHRISDLFIQRIFLETLRFFLLFELDYQVQELAC